MNNKKKRQQAIRDIVASKGIADQKKFLVLLSRLGFELNQATLSRDLAELMIAKIHGNYRLAQINLPQESPYKILSFIRAGSNLLVLKTMPGQASALALDVDRLGCRHILGTIAGDDNVFIATENKKGQKQVITQLSKYFLFLK